VCVHEEIIKLTPKIKNNFLMLINIFGGLFFPPYLCVGALLFGEKYKAGWSILGPVASVTIPQR
jgi:hypothetical protein